jgi:hypothetical protein
MHPSYEFTCYMFITWSRRFFTKEQQPVAELAPLALYLCY